MTFKSRLRQRRATKTITSIAMSLSSGKYTQANELTGLTATYEQRSAQEIGVDAGALTPVVDVFYFDLVSGSLPDIEEDNVLTDGDSVRYEVIEVKQFPNRGRLRVVTRRIR